MIEDDRISALEKGVHVVPRAAWIVLGSIGTLVAALGVWSFVGEIPTKVSGNCIFMRAGGIAEVPAPATGRLSELQVKPGDAIKAGQVIARLAQPEFDDRIRRAEARVRELQTRARELASLSHRGLELNEQALRQRTDFLHEQIAVAESRVRIASDQAATSRQLLADGLVTHRAAEDAERELRAAQISVRELSRQSAELEKSRTEVVKRETDERA